MTSRNEALEDSKERGVEDTVYVALGKDMKKCIKTLMWSLGNSGGKRICILHVHQPAQRILPAMGARVPASSLREDVLREYRETERQNMHDLLDKYLKICRQNGVEALKLYIEMDSIQKGIVELISQHGIRQLVMGMGATAEQYHPKKMMEIRRSKVKYVREQAPVYCQIQFICKGHLTFTREASAETETGKSSDLKSQSFPLQGPYQNREASAETETGQPSYLKSQSLPLEGNMVSTATGPPNYSSAPSVTLGHNVTAMDQGGTNKIDAIVVDLPKGDDILQLSPKALIKGNAHFSGEVCSLPNELIVRDWHGYHLSLSLPSNFSSLKFKCYESLKHLPESIFQLQHLESLQIEECPRFIGFGKKLMDDNIQFMASIVPNREYEISGSPPRNSSISELRSLKFKCCKSLTHLPESIFQLQHLESLQMEECPRFIGFGEKPMEDNRQFMASIVSKREYEISGSPPRNSSISGLRSLEFNCCENLMHLPGSIFQLQHLEFVRIAKCPQFIGFGETLIEDNKQFMESIMPNKEYEISGSPPRNSSISNDDCYKEAGVWATEFLSPDNFILSESNCFRNSTWHPTLSKLDLSETSIVSLPASIKSFVRLRCLYLEECKQLQEILELPQKIEEVHARGCISLESFSQVSKKFQFDTSDDSIDKLFWLDLSRCHKMLKKLSNPVLSPSLRRDLIGPIYAGQEIPTSWFSLLEDYVLDGIADSGRGLPTWFSHCENSLNANRCRIYVDWQECSEEAITIALCAVFVFRRPSLWTPEMGKVNAAVVLEGLSPRRVEGTTALIGNESTWGPQHLFLAYTTVTPSELKGNHLEVKFSASTDAGAIEIESCEVHRVDEHKQRVKARKRRNENKARGRAKDGQGVLGGETDVQMDLSKAEPENLHDLLSTIQLYQSSKKGQFGKQYRRLKPWQH